MININNAWLHMQAEWQVIRESGRVDANDIQYHAQQLINAYVAGLINQLSQPHYRSCYYRTNYNINDLPVTIRVANHRGYCDASFKRSSHCNTGITAFDSQMQAEPVQYIISIEVTEDRYNQRLRTNITTDNEDNITRIELININCLARLEDCLSFIDSELSDLLD